MWLKKYFVNTSLYYTFRSIRGALLGVLGGLGVGIIIWGILMLIDIIISVETSFCTMPPSSVTLITTILGALAGSVFGFCAAMKESDYEHKK